MAKATKIQKNFQNEIDRKVFYTVETAVDILQKISKQRKFDETFEISMNLGVDPKHSDQAVRGMTTLPHGTGKSVRVAVFAKDAKAEEAKKAGADYVGAEDLAEQLQKNEIEVDRCIATPDMMAVVGKLGKILGPKGLMPNPKLGTVTPDVQKAIQDAKGGAVEFRAEKNGIVHGGLGKASFDKKAIVENVYSYVDAIMKAKPSGAKGTYVKKVTLTTTMGPGLKIDIADLLSAGEQKKAA